MKNSEIIPGFLDHSHPLMQLGFAMFLTILSLLVFTTIGLIIAIPLFNIDLGALISGGGNIALFDNLAFLKYFQALQSISVFLLPPVFMAFFVYRPVSVYLSFSKMPHFFSSVLVLLIMLSALPVISYLGEVNAKMKLPEFMSGLEAKMKAMEESAKVLTERFVKVSTWGAFFVNLFILAFLPAVSEEFFFRGMLQKIFHRWTKNAHWAVWITAFIFSAIHMQFYGFLPRLLLGAVFGYFLVWSGTIWLPVLAHFINNALAVFLYFWVEKNQLHVDLDKIGTHTENLLAAVLGIFVALFLMKFLYKRENIRNA